MLAGKEVGKENTSLYKIFRITVTLYNFDLVPFLFFRISAIHILRAKCVLKVVFLDEDRDAKLGEITSNIINIH